MGQMALDKYVLSIHVLMKMEHGKYLITSMGPTCTSIPGMTVILWFGMAFVELNYRTWSNISSESELNIWLWVEEILYRHQTSQIVVVLSVKAVLPLCDSSVISTMFHLNEIKTKDGSPTLPDCTPSGPWESIPSIIYSYAWTGKVTSLSSN